MAPTNPSLTFYFDFISPYAYLAWTQIHQLAQRHGYTVEPKPILFAGLLKAHGQLGPAEIPAKARWMHHNLQRRARRLGVPIQAPASHPFNPLPALRASSLELPNGARRQLIDYLFQALWVEGREATAPDLLSDAATAAGIKTDLLQQAHTDAVKTKLRQRTEEAIQLGLFGVPTSVVDGQLYWGCDELGDLEEALAGKESLDQDQLAAWARVRPSATRRGS